MLSRYGLHLCIATTVGLFAIGFSPKGKAQQYRESHDTYPLSLQKVTTKELPPQKSGSYLHNVSHPMEVQLTFKGKYLPKMEDVSCFTNGEFTILHSWFRRSPKEPWIDAGTTSPGYESLDGGSSSSEFAEAGSMVGNGQIYKLNVRLCPVDKFQWRLKIKGDFSNNFTGRSKLISEYNINANSAFVFEAITAEVPPEKGVPFNAALVSGILYASSPQGPWKPIPQKGEKGFPLVWTQRHRLYLRAAKQFPDQPWPKDAEPAPEALAPVQFSGGGVREISKDTVALATRQPVNTGNTEQLWTFGSEANNKVTRQILIKPQNVPLAHGLSDWNDLHKTLLSMTFPSLPQWQEDQSKVVLNFSAGQKLTFPVLPKVEIKLPNISGLESVYPIKVHLKVSDAKGKAVFQAIQTISDFNRTPNNQFQVTVPKVGTYLARLDVLDPDGRVVQLKNDLQRIDSSIHVALTPLPTPSPATQATQAAPSLPTYTNKELDVTYGEWEPSSQPDVWQRDIFVHSTWGNSVFNSVNTYRVKVKIAPQQGFPNDKRVSWLSAPNGQFSTLKPYSPGPNDHSYSGLYETGIKQFYKAAPKNFPANASTQMGIYTVKMWLDNPALRSKKVVTP